MSKIKSGDSKRSEIILFWWNAKIIQNRLKIILNFFPILAWYQVELPTLKTIFFAQYFFEGSVKNPSSSHSVPLTGSKTRKIKEKIIDLLWDYLVLTFVIRNFLLQNLSCICTSVEIDILSMTSVYSNVRNNIRQTLSKF